MVSQTMEKKKTSTKLNTAVVILNWNGRQYLEQFLPALIEHSVGIEIIIIDNNSSDDSVLFLNKNYPNIRIIQLDKNYGFTGGYNRGLQQIEAENYILLNSDIEVGARWWQPLISRLNSEERVGAVQPKIKSYHNKKFFEYAGACGGFIDKYGYPFCRGRILNHTEQDNGQYDTPIEIFWATGATLAIKSKIFHELNGFDEDFFAHMEEIDLCWRLQNKGYKIYCEPQSEVFHVGGGTLSNDSPFKLYLNFRNNLFMIYKNTPKNSLFKKIFIRLLLDGIAGLKFLLSGKFKSFISILKAHKSFYTNINKLKQKRKNTLQKQNIRTIYPHSILWKYFARKKIFFSELRFFS